MARVGYLLAFVIFSVQSSSAATVYEFMGNEKPGFHFDISPDGEYMISSTEINRIRFKFNLYDLKKQEHFWFEHNVDLVSPHFSPDSKYVIFPDARFEFGDQISRQRFFNFSDFKADAQAGRLSNPVLVDDDFNSFAYSVGQYMNSSQQTVNRIFGYRWYPNYTARFVFRDYVVNPSTGILEPFSDFKEGCLNEFHPDKLGFSNWLFSLSKNGEIVAGDNLDDDRTDLFKIDQNGGCKFIASLPRRANSVSFNYSNKKVIYSNYLYPPFSLDRIVLDVYEFDLVSGEERRITNNGGSVDSLNPQYDSFGNIYYLNYSTSRVTLEKESGKL